MPPARIRRLYLCKIPDHILLTLYNDGPASAVLTAVRETFQTEICPVLMYYHQYLALLINEMK